MTSLQDTIEALAQCAAMLFKIVPGIRNGRSRRGLQSHSGAKETLSNNYCDDRILDYKMSRN